MNAKLKNRIQVFAALGQSLKKKVMDRETDYEAVCKEAYLKNNWFTGDNIDQAFKEWSSVLTEKNISQWINNYAEKISAITPKRVAVINAGNIPLVGLHDLLSVLICGHAYTGRNSSEDNLLLPYVTTLLTEIDPELKNNIRFTQRLDEFDAVIATGSNNSARYFESYFGSYPHVIRKNRNGVAVLAGAEKTEDLVLLGSDIFQYFGLGCRNVSKLYVPEGYDFKNFFESIFSFSQLMQHNKYMNNFDYNNAMLLMKQIPFLQNGFLIIREEKQIASPVAVLHYEKYRSITDLEKELYANENRIQCVISNSHLNLSTDLRNRTVSFGKAQSPALSDYADGLDVIEFLISC